MYNNPNIDDQVADVIMELYPFSKGLLNENGYSNPLTAQPLRLGGISLVYLFFELEKRFQVSFSEEDLIDYRFCSIKQIAEHIREKAADVSMVK